ncbi:hypothetical protein Cgig2_010410 [Carnegiea gigantea]|uniref:Uncharacterized protein n=1 Tax=Carnegiea gigantea TaxID=171969 RepID=A0A9Q1JRC2_9CARY|nr:hypothetical protein Cgig2_010410 [Carnegiea gigantea]
MEISDENANGRPASNHRIRSREEYDEGDTFSNSGDNSQGTASYNFLETREDALAINATSNSIPNYICKEPHIPVNPLLPGLVAPNFESIVSVSSKEPSSGLGRPSRKAHSKKKKVKRRLKQSKNGRRGSLARKKRVDFSKAIKEYQLSKTPNKFSQEDTKVAKAPDLGVEVEQPSFKPKELESEKPRSNSISAEDLIEFAKKLGVPFIRDEETYGGIRS